MFLTFKLLALYTSWLVFLLPSSGIPLTKDRNHYLVATHGNFIDNVRVQTPTSFNCKEPSVLINFANIVSSPHKHVASSCHSHPTETEFLKYTVSFVQLCESLPSKSPFGKRCMRWCRHSQWWTSNFPIFLADTTTYILLFQLITWIYNIHLQVIVVGNSFGCGISWRICFTWRSHLT